MKIFNLFRKSKNINANTGNVFNSIRINALVKQLDSIGAIDRIEYEKNVADEIHKLINGGR